MVGTIIKIHSDFYYVKLEEVVFECKIREKLKKEKVQPFVGDKVVLSEMIESSKQAVIVEILERNNYLPRPQIANVDQVIIVASLSQPSSDFSQIDRYLIHSKMHNLPVILCINKADLNDKAKSKQKIQSVYEKCGYKVLFTSAANGNGIDELKELLTSRVSVFCGASGVGKSSLLNKINPELNLKTKKISSKTQRGTHSTRHVEIISINEGENTIQVADTPGFSYLKFDNILPESMGTLFDEIFELSCDCYYNDCLHLEEEKCNVLSNIDMIEPSRYNSYKAFVSEALEYKEKLNNSGYKNEDKTKIIDSRNNEKLKLVKIGAQARAKSRKNQKQKLNLISTLKDTYYNNEEIEFE